MSSDDSAVGLSPVSGDTSQHEAIKGFLDSVRNLASEKSFEKIEQLIAENSSLRLEVKSQGDENERLKSEIETLKVNTENKVKELSDSHEQDYHRLLKINRESVAKEELEKTNLQTKLSAIQTELKEERREKAEIQKHSQDLQQMNAEYAARHTEEIEKAAKVEKKLQELRTTLRGREEQMKKNKEDIRKQELSISSLKSSLQTLEDEKKSITAQRTESERKLQQIHRFTQNLFDDDLAEAVNRLQESWQSCLKAVRSCFEEDLPDSVLRDSEAWKKLRVSNQVTYLTVLPPSNSREAKQMRVFVILAILAASLSRHIFTTTYLLKDDSDLRQVLRDLAEADRGKEAFCRALLLSISEETQLHKRRERVSAVLREVVTPIQDLVGQAARDRFRSELEALTEKAAQMWWTIQRRRSHFEADVSAEVDDHGEWQMIECTEDGMGIATQRIPAAEFARDAVVSVLFPRVYIVNEETDSLVFPGVVLRSSQTAAADREMQRIKAASPVMGKTPSPRTTRQRKMTLTNPAQNGTGNVENGGFLGQEQFGRRSSDA